MWVRQRTYLYIFHEQSLSEVYSQLLIPCTTHLVPKSKSITSASELMVALMTWMDNVCYGKWKWGHTPSFWFRTPHRACSQLLLVLLLLMRFFIFLTHANTNTQEHTHPYDLYLLRSYWNRPHWSLETEGHPASRSHGSTDWPDEDQRLPITESMCAACLYE